VNDDGHAVGREPHVELDAVGSGAARKLEGGQGVLRRVGRSAAVRDDEGAA